MQGRDRQQAPVGLERGDRYVPRETLGALLLTLGGLAVALALGWASRGVYHDDDIAHVHLAWAGWNDVHSLLHQWARPGYNLPTTPVARFLGVEGCRAFSALQTALVAWLAYLIARRLLRRAGVRTGWAALAPAFVWLQPITLILAFTSLTETTAALYLALALWLYLRGNRVWAFLALSALFVTRYETLALVPVFAVAVVLDALRESGGSWRRALRRGWPWACAAAGLLLPALYALAAWVADMPAFMSPLHMFSRSYSTVYGSGALYDMPLRWGAQAGMAVVALTLVGMVRLGRPGRGGVLTTALVVTLVSLHAYLWWAGKFATGGHPRFFVPLTAPVAVLAVAGLAYAWEGRRWIIAILPVVALGTFVAGLLLWPHFFPPWLQAHATAIATTLLATAGVAVLAAMLLPRRAVVATSRGLGVLMVLIAVVQAAVQAQPLPLNARPYHPPIARAVAWTEEDPQRGRRVITEYVSVHLVMSDIEERVIWAHTPDALIDAWRAAKPGTLFLWLDEPGLDPADAESARRVHLELVRLAEGGGPSHESAGEGYRALVFARSSRAADD